MNGRDNDDGVTSSRDEVPLPRAPVAEEWERFLRADRPGDYRPIVLTEGQLNRISYIVGSALKGGPAADDAHQQLAAVKSFLTSLDAESKGLPMLPTSSQAWDRIEAMPYYLPAPEHLQRLDDLRRQGLDPYGHPLPPHTDQPG